MPQIHMAWAACCAHFGPGPLHKGIDQLVDVKPTEKLGTGLGAAPYAGHMQPGGLYDMTCSWQQHLHHAGSLSGTGPTTERSCWLCRLLKITLQYITTVPCVEGGGRGMRTVRSRAPVTWAGLHP